MFTIDIYDDERHTLTARIGELIPDNGRGSIWFGELLRTESGRVAYGFSTYAVKRAAI